MLASDEVTVAILAGGRSRRMGADKSFLPVAGKPLIQHVIERVSTLHLPVILITNKPKRHAAFDLPMYGDIYRGQGSLGGLYTAIHYSLTDYTLCVACDMPFLNVELLRYMLGLRSEADVVVPYLAGYYESLHAVYRRTCLRIMRDRLEQDQLRISDIFSQLRVRMVHETEVECFDLERRSFVNLNTPDDVAQVADRLA